MSVKSRSFERREMRKCRAKQGYGSEAEAVSKISGNKLEPYKCRFYPDWHLTKVKNKRGL